MKAVVIVPLALIIASSWIIAGKAVDSLSVTRSEFPLPLEAKSLLNSTHHHGDWIRVQSGSKTILAAVDYPDRADKAAVVMITAKDQRLTDWLRAVADQLASEGFITVVPDTLSTASPDIDAVRGYVARHPAANGKSASITFSTKIDVAAAGNSATFEVAGESWPEIVAFLNKQTANDPSKVVYIPPHSHAGHEMFEPEPQATPQRGGGQRGYPAGKLDNLPAGIFTARTTVLRSTIKSEWVEVPMPGVYTGKMHTRITYPEGNGKAGIVVVMQHGPGMDDWMRALGDQLSRDGFIALVPDLHTGMGPNGGNYDSFDGPDGAFAANARLIPAQTLAAYKAVRDYGMKLPRANGKSASIGFCMGGGTSWVFATEVPGLNAAVVYYGTAPGADALAKIKAPVLGFYGEDDARITATVEQTGTEMKRLGKSFESHVYPHATHGFLEFQDLGGNPMATSDSWTRTIAFLRQNLK
jgi:carboxymethylenebutenolidase